MTEDRLNAYHIMWLFVFFDLPVTTKKEMKAASGVNPKVLIRVKYRKKLSVNLFNWSFFSTFA